MTSWLFECICVQDEEDNSALSTSVSTNAINENNSQQKKTGRVDTMVVYTGALGSRDFIDDNDLDDDTFSEIHSSFEYGSAAGDMLGSTMWSWPRGMHPPDSWIQDPKKSQLIIRAQQLIDRAEIDFHELALQVDFRLDNLAIVRYLEANLWQPLFPNGQEPAERIMETILWRRKFKLPVRNKTLLRKELETGKNFVNGKAKDGRPIVYLFLGKENTWDPTGNTIALVYTLERAIRSMSVGVTDTVCIVDCSGLGVMNSPSTTFVGMIIDILGRHYPRRNGQIFITNVSSTFYFVWNVVSLSLSDVTKKKIQILTSDLEEMRRVIGATVDPDILSREFGGNANVKFAVDSYLEADPFLNTAI